MPSVTVRNISEDIHRGLRVRAAQRGRSMEAELREILAIASGVRRPAAQRPAAARPSAPETAPAGARVPPQVMAKLREILHPAAE